MSSEAELDGAVDDPQPVADSYTNVEHTPSEEVDTSGIEPLKLLESLNEYPDASYQQAHQQAVPTEYSETSYQQVHQQTGVNAPTPQHQVDSTEAQVQAQAHTRPQHSPERSRRYSRSPRRRSRSRSRDRARGGFDRRKDDSTDDLSSRCVHDCTRTMLPLFFGTV
jgi:hypothetical protein